MLQIGRPSRRGIRRWISEDFLCVKESRCLDARLADRLAKVGGEVVRGCEQKRQSPSLDKKTDRIQNN